MGLATYDDLKAAVADWLDREDLAGRTGDFIWRSRPGRVRPNWPPPPTCARFCPWSGRRTGRRRAFASSRGGWSWSRRRRRECRLC